MNTERNERVRSSYLHVLVSIQKWIRDGGANVRTTWNIPNRQRARRQLGDRSRDAGEASRVVAAVAANQADARPSLSARIRQPSTFSS
jgi:hypothetical protein